MGVSGSCQYHAGIRSKQEVSEQSHKQQERLVSIDRTNCTRGYVLKHPMAPRTAPPCSRTGQQDSATHYNARPATASPDEVSQMQLPCLQQLPKQVYKQAKIVT